MVMTVLMIIVMLRVILKTILIKMRMTGFCVKFILCTGTSRHMYLTGLVGEKCGPSLNTNGLSNAR